MATQQGQHGRSDQGRRAFTAEQVAAMVVDARPRVTTTATRHPRFSGLSEADVEELFDATSEMVLGRHDTYDSADHVRASLWRGMELRALDTFKRRKRRPQLDADALALVTEDLVAHDDRISDEQELLVVHDFLAAMTPREADVWKLVHGEELSIVQTSKRLGISRHATGEHLETATRKLEVFLAIRRAGEWCGRREADILRLVDGSDDAGTARRAMAHLRACGVCRRAYGAQVRETGRIAAGVLPLPAVLAGEHGRSIVERLVDLLPFGSSGSGRSEMIGTALLGGGGGLAGVAKVGAVVATTATVAVGAGTVVVDRDAGTKRTPTTEASAPSPAPAPSGAALAPAPVAQVVTAPTTPTRAATRRTAARAAESTRAASTSQRKAAARQRAAERREDVFELGTIESTGTSGATSSSTASAPAASAPAKPAPEPAGQESFLP